jgi:hypothetical protein
MFHLFMFYIICDLIFVQINPRPQPPSPSHSPAAPLSYAQISAQYAALPQVWFFIYFRSHDFLNMILD